MTHPLALSREQIRTIDRLAIERYRIPGIVLMENAGRNAAELIRHHALPTPNRGTAAILCGGGNNGGDGLVVARHLANAGIRVQVFLAAKPERLAPEAATNHEIASRMAIPIVNILASADVAAVRKAWSEADTIVDALLGTGFAGTVRSPASDMIDTVNRIRDQRCGNRPFVVAIDIPSGLDADTAEPAAATIRADLTITMAARKLAFDNPTSVAFTGDVQLVDIGVPRDLLLGNAQAPNAP
ncbi:MAG: NAD(P)H-hydrate epimerase [Phycisphaerae bacterium]|nr:NAD(P)H-hydrate epimerase [Phycisphaerae bacterium]